jgi:adenylate cyclase
MEDVGTDFESKRLLDGLEGDDREARLQLLKELKDDGVSLEELEAAVEEDRIALLPVERVYDPPGERYTIKEVAEEAGVPVEALTRYQRALGLRVPDPDERVAGEHLLEMAKLLRGFLDAGLPEDGLIEVTRVIGLAMSQVARAVSQITAETVLADAQSERDVAIRLAEAARLLTPMANEIFDHAFRVHQLEVLRSEVVGSEQIQSGRLAGSQEYTIAFADLVGFTKLGERLEPDEYGAVTERLAELAADIAEPPVRLVKLIGDAAMLASRENTPVVVAALALQAAAEEDGELPELRIGVARGSALPRAGDLYGRAVNLASRLTAIARPGSVLADEAAMKASKEDLDWSSAGSKRIKGIRGSVKLYRARENRDAD